VCACDWRVCTVYVQRAGRRRHHFQQLRRHAQYAHSSLTSLPLRRHGDVNELECTLLISGRASDRAVLASARAEVASLRTRRLRTKWRCVHQRRQIAALMRLSTNIAGYGELPRRTKHRKMTAGLEIGSL